MLQHERTPAMFQAAAFAKRVELLADHEAIVLPRSISVCALHHVAGLQFSESLPAPYDVEGSVPPSLVKRRDTDIPELPLESLGAKR